MEPQINLFFWSAISFIALCAMMLFARANNRLWKTAIYLGIGATGYAMIGYIAPATNVYPNECFVIGITIMLVCIAFNYYKYPLPDMSEQAIERRHRGIMFVSIGTGIVLLFTVVTAFNQSRTKETVATQNFTEAIISISKEVSRQGKAILGVQKDVKDIQEKVDQKSALDSARYKETQRKLNAKK